MKVDADEVHCRAPGLGKLGKRGKRPKVFLRLRGSANRRVDLYLPLIASNPGGMTEEDLDTLVEQERQAMWDLTRIHLSARSEG